MINCPFCDADIKLITAHITRVHADCYDVECHRCKHTIKIDRDFFANDFAADIQAFSIKINRILEGEDVPA